MRKIIALMIVCCGMLYGGLDEAKRDYEKKLLALKASYEKQVLAVKKGYLGALKKQQKYDARRGNIDEVIAIQTEIDKIEAAISQLKSRKFTIKYTTGIRVYTLTATGEVLYSGKVSGKYKMDGANIGIAHDNGSTEVWVHNNGGFSIEFYPADGRPTIKGVAYEQ